MKSGRGTYLAVLTALIVLVGALGSLAVFGADRPAPERDIASPAPAFATQTMYVSPGETGSASGGDEESTDENEDARTDQQLQQEEQQQEESEQGSSGEGFTPEGGGNRPGGQDGSGNPGSPDEDDDDPVVPPDPDPDRDPDPSDPPRQESAIPRISTNLMNYEAISAETPAPQSMGITYEEKSGLDLLARKLFFYAIPTDMTRGYSVLVEYANDQTGWEKVELEGSVGLFGLPVVLTDGAYTDVTLTLVDSNGARTNRVAEYRVTYAGSQNSDESRQGPDITLNFYEGQRFAQSPVTLTVSARDHYDNSVIYAEHIEVTLVAGGKSYVIEAHGARDPYEYTIDFNDYLLEGDETEFTVTVRAWDYSSERAESIETRTIVYEHHPFGEVIGQATVVIDATPVGLGVVSTFSIDLHQGYAFPRDLIEGLTDAGLRPEYTGTFDRSFYLSGISAGGLFAGQSIDDELMHKIEQDKITWTGSHSADTLSDHDYTNVSGWLYNVNDSWWPSVSLDGYTASPGDTVYLIYSVAGGKEVGSPGGGTGGALSTYCGIWRNGTYTEMHDLSEYVVSKEPTCSEDGEARYVCSAYGCGAWGSETGSHANGEKIAIPATGEHVWVEDPLHSEEPSAGFDGVRAFKCEQCGELKYEPWVCEHEWEDDPGTTVAPTATEDGVYGYVCSLCGETKTEVWHCDHSWKETGRVEPADGEDGWIEYVCSKCGASKTEELEWVEPEPEPDPDGGNGGNGAAASTQSLAPQSERTPYAFFCAMSWSAL